MQGKHVQAIIYKAVKGQPRFLILKRVAEKGSFWQSVTGGVEVNESLEDAAKREVFEETGIRTYKKLIPDIYSFKFQSAKHGQLKESVFAIEVDDTQAIKLSPFEHNEYKWVNFETAIEHFKYDSSKEALKKLKTLIV